MDNHFFEQILANAQSKKNAEQKIKAEVLKQSKEVLRDYAKPILDFLFLINEKYVFNDRVFMSGFCFSQKLALNTLLPADAVSLHKCSFGTQN